MSSSRSNVVRRNPDEYRDRIEEVSGRLGFVLGVAGDPVRVMEAAITRLRQKPCPVCGGVGSVNGFWLGTIKTCPTCRGKGHQ